MAICDYQYGKVIKKSFVDFNYFHFHSNQNDDEDLLFFGDLTWHSKMVSVFKYSYFL